ncbi:MAG: mannose-1-phosphate guanylyltransferase [Acidimicrobiia bacterium]
MISIRPVVLSGGSGTRLWPLSTPGMPKQFVRLFGDESLFDQTLSRLQGLPGLGETIVVTGSRHLDLAKRSIAASGAEAGSILVEPTGRNTAPAAIAAALLAHPDDVIVILPSDHLVADVGAFREGVVTAAELAMAGGIVTFGIAPSRPETGYGYIEKGEPGASGAFAVARFKEKPDLAEARRLVSGGRHLWNSGMFVARAGTFLEEASKYSPDLVEGVREATGPTETGIVELGPSFADVEAISIDYAIMEKTDRALVLPIEVGWDDVGSYQSLLDASDRDEAGNHTDGRVVLSEVTGSLIMATSRVVAVAGLSDVVVVETPDAVLVVPLGRAQEVRDLARRADQD